MAHVSKTSLACLVFFAVANSFVAVAQVHESLSSGSTLRPSQKELQISDSATMQLAKKDHWRKLLYFAPSWLRKDRSLVDDERFFLSIRGSFDPEAELKSTLKAFVEGSSGQRQEALCQYPARRLWLERELKTKFSDPEPENSSEICKRFKIFKQSVHANKVSLIFSSYYPGNPGSLFGHTLLKFTKVNDSGIRGSELLDYGLNHAAYPTTQNPFLYAPMGLAGFFPGFISLMPYYVKVQEYNNAESRDLWEYELNLTPQEVELSVLSVFELSTHRIDYYYFDDNCSLLMLAVLDVARPTLKLVEKFNSWVIPGDTVRIVHQYPGLVSNFKFRASNVRRYLSLVEKLSKKERDSLDRLILEKKANRFLPNEVLPALNPTEQVHVLDTLLEYIDADEQLVGSKEPEKWKAERPELLKLRAQLGIASAANDIPPPRLEAPHEAFPPTRLTLGGIVSRTAGIQPEFGALLGWRPALHTLDNPLAGMGADLGVAFFNLEILLLKKKLLLREFTPLGIETMPVDQPHFSSRSWHFSMGYRQRCFADCGQTTIAGGLGRAWKLGAENSRLAARFDLRVGDDRALGVFAEPGVSSLLNIPLDGDARWITKFSLSRAINLKADGLWYREARSSFVFRPASTFEIDISAAYRNGEMEYLSRGSWYF